MLISDQFCYKKFCSWPDLLFRIDWNCILWEFMFHVEGFALVNNDGNFNFNHIMTRDFSGWVPARNYFTIKIQQNWNSSLFILDFKYLNFITPDFMEQNLIKHNFSVGWLFWFGNEGYSLSNQMVS